MHMHVHMHTCLTQHMHACLSQLCRARTVRVPCACHACAMHVPRCGGGLSRHCLRSSPHRAGRSTTRYNPYPNPNPNPNPNHTPTPNQVDYPLQHGISAAEIDLLLGDGDGAQPGTPPSCTPPSCTPPSCTPPSTKPDCDAAGAARGGAAAGAVEGAAEEAVRGGAAGAAGPAAAGSYGGRVSLQAAARLCVLRDDASGDAAALQTDEAIRRVLLRGSIGTRNDLDAAQLVGHTALAQRGTLLEAEAAAQAAAAAAAEAAAAGKRAPGTRPVCAEMAAALRASEALALDRLCSCGGAAALFGVSS